jgi:hypothetical protein
MPAVLTLQSLTLWPQYRDARNDEVRKSLAAGLHPDELAGLQQLKMNLLTAGPSSSWFTSFGAKSCGRKDLLTELFSNLRVLEGRSAEKTIAELLRALRIPEGYMARWFEAAAAAHFKPQWERDRAEAAARARTLIPVTPLAPGDQEEQRATPEEVDMNETMERIAAILDREGVDLRYAVPGTIQAPIARELGYDNWATCISPYISKIRAERGIAFLGKKPTNGVYATNGNGKHHDPPAEPVTADSAPQPGEPEATSAELPPTAATGAREALEVLRDRDRLQAELEQARTDLARHRETRQRVIDAQATQFKADERLIIGQRDVARKELAQAQADLRALQEEHQALLEAREELLALLSPAPSDAPEDWLGMAPPLRLRWYIEERSRWFQACCDARIEMAQLGLRVAPPPSSMIPVRTDPETQEQPIPIRLLEPCSVEARSALSASQIRQATLLSLPEEGESPEERTAMLLLALDHSALNLRHGGGR